MTDKVGASGRAVAANAAEPVVSALRASIPDAQSPLQWLHARGHLSDRQYDAGGWLRADYHRSVGGPSPRQMEAKGRFDGAMAQAGRGLKDILWHVAIKGGGIPEAERTLSWPARSGKLVLKLALERVADFYGLRDTDGNPQGADAKQAAGESLTAGAEGIAQTPSGDNA